MKHTAFIFARGGSKGIPGKNLRIFGGKPLIAWAIEQALAVNKIERVIVSTDSLEIADVAKKFGAKVPFIRPDEFATDESPEWLAWRHALEYLKITEGLLPKAMISVPATSPLRLSEDIENCINEYEKGDLDVVIAVTQSHRNPFFNMVKIDSNGNCGLVCTRDLHINRRQDCPSVYDLTTVCYVVRPEFVMEKSSIFEGRVRAVHIPVERSIDIDTLIDFQIAEFLLSIRD